MTGFLTGKVHDQPRWFALHVGRRLNRLATNIATSEGKRTRGLSCGVEKNLQSAQVTSKGARATAPAQSDEQRPGILIPAACLWRPFGDRRLKGLRTCP